jgi:hypothetical protein
LPSCRACRWSCSRSEVVAVPAWHRDRLGNLRELGAYHLIASGG